MVAAMNLYWEGDQRRRRLLPRLLWIDVRDFPDYVARRLSNWLLRHYEVGQ